MGALVLVASLLAACSSGAPSSVSGASTGPSDGSSVQSDPDGEVGGNSAAATSASSDQAALREAGSLTLGDTSGSPVSYTFTLSVPDPSVLPQAVPEEVLNACNANYTDVKATLVPMHAQLAITYNGGSLPEVVTLVSSELLGSTYGGSIGLVAFPGDGGWICRDSSLNLNINAGQTKTLDVWLLPQLLSNTHPTVDQAVLDDVQLSPGGISGGGLSYVTHNTSAGPGGFCPGMLFLYATSGSCPNNN